MKSTVQLQNDDIERYSRQITLEDIGFEGQTRLKNSRVVLFGIGGLGSPTALKLTAMGVGFLRVVDRDVVSRSDLHRQYLYDMNTVGLPKVEAATKRLEILNPSVKIEPIAAAVTSYNVGSLVKDVDVIIDGLDSIETRYTINRAAVMANKPFVFGAAIEAFGNASTIIPTKGACLECFYSGLKEENLDRCAVVGVHPSVLDIISSVQVSEVTRILIGKEAHLKNQLFYVDIRNFSFDVIRLAKNLNCKVCGASPEVQKVEERIASGLCGRDGKGVFTITSKETDVNLDAIYSRVLGRNFIVEVRGNMGLTFQYNEKISISVLKGGTSIIQASPKSGLTTAEDALKLYKSVATELNLPPV